MKDNIRCFLFINDNFIECWLLVFKNNIALERRACAAKYRQSLSF